MSQITTHILDTTRGKPAESVTIILYHQETGNGFTELARGITNADGRISDLLPANITLEKGIYKLKFETLAYYDRQMLITFYPFVEIVFEIITDEHYHVPLLLNPYGYSTYRGS